MIESKRSHAGIFTAGAGTALAILLALALSGTVFAQSSPCCSVPDNGTGTADLPPNCLPDGYRGHVQLIDGFPAGTTMECAAKLYDFTVTSQVPGGSLGGTVETFTAVMHLDIVGTGEFQGFMTSVDLAAHGVTHSAPRVPGAAVQEIEFDVYRLHADLFDDFDFRLLQLEGGSVHLLPSPGHTTLTRLGPPGSDFAVDSFFDLHYRIQFEGNFYSELAQYRGITQGLNYVFEVCEEPIPVRQSTWSRIKARY